jgi:hypothetical protein
MIKLVYHAEDAALAKRILNDAHAAEFNIEDLKTGEIPAREDVLIPIFAENEDDSSTLHEAVYMALDRGLHIVPILRGASLPKLLDHLDHVDFTEAYDFEALKMLIDAALDPNTPRPVKVLTPNMRRSNQRIGWIVAAAAIAMFLIGIYGIGVLGIQAPREEYDAVETEIIQTRDVLIAPELATMEGLLPTNPDEAFVYPATLLSASTQVRPFVEQTATAYAATSEVLPATPTAGQ